MQVIFLWLITVGEAVAAALALSRNSTVVQRVVRSMEPYAESIAIRASELYNECLAFAESRGLTIIRENVWTFTKMAMEESGRWYEIEQQLIRNGVGPETIEQLSAEFIELITVRVLGGGVPVDWAVRASQTGTGLPWPVSLIIKSGVEVPIDCSSFYSMATEAYEEWQSGITPSPACEVRIRQAESMASLLAATGKCGGEEFYRGLGLIRYMLADVLSHRIDEEKAIIPLPLAMVIGAGLALLVAWAAGR